VIPRIRLGSRSINVLWAIPLVVVLLIFGIAVAQQLRSMPGVQEFIARYPGVTSSSEAVYSGFPLWPRLLHFFNLFTMMFIILAGIQILADHPRLY
jgi:sulfoxide reductase catalytic subunit YedY